MYCPSCGAQWAQSLSYCNRCGVKLAPLRDQQAHESVDTTINTLVWVIVGSTITLLGMALGALVLMKDGAIDAGLGAPLVIFTFFALVLVEMVLIWRLRSLTRKVSARSDLSQANDLNLDGTRAQPEALPEAREPVPSVTEQTTRPMETSHRRKAQL